MLYSGDCFVRDSCAKFSKGLCPKDSFCLKLFKLESLYDLAMLSESQRKHIDLRIDADGTDRASFVKLRSIEDDIENFIHKGKNIYLYSSNCGNGKTSWAIRLLQSYMNKIWYKTDISCRALFISVPRFFIMLKDNISEKNEYIRKIKENVFDCDLVVWDDIGTKVGTEFEIENLLSIIDSRLNGSKSNIYTSNMNPVELNDRVGERLYSRIVNNSENIQLLGRDKRGL